MRASPYPASSRCSLVAIAWFGVATASPALAQTPPPASVAPSAAPEAVVVAAPAPPREGLLTGLDPAKPVRFDLSAATEFPIMVAGASGVLDVPYGIQVRADIGWLGTPYTNAINGFLDAIGAYGSGQTASSTQELLQAALQNSLVVRAALGWRPFAKYGFEVFGGYSLITLGGSLGAQQAIEAVTGKQFATAEEKAALNINSTLHNLNIGVGWRWLFVNDHLVLRASAEYLQTVASSTSLSFQGTTRSSDLPNISAAVDGYLGGIYATYVKVPVVSLSLGYRF